MSIYILSPELKKTYSAILAAIDRWENTVRISRISVQQALSLYKKALSESKYGYVFDSSSIQLNPLWDGTILGYNYHSNAGRSIGFHAAVEFEIDKILDIARKADNEYGEVLLVYRYFVENYNYATKQVGQEGMHNAANPFICNRAVCEGFSLAFSIVLNRLGIPCGIVTGTSLFADSNSDHAWNIAWIGNQIYNFDVTWDICTKEKGLGVFDYFCCGDKTFRRDHQWNDPLIPKCLDESKDYYAVFGEWCIAESDFVPMVASMLPKHHNQVFLRCLNMGHQFYEGDYLIHLFKQAATLARMQFTSTQVFFNRSAGTVKYYYSEH